MTTSFAKLTEAYTDHDNRLIEWTNKIHDVPRLIVAAFHTEHGFPRTYQAPGEQAPVKYIDFFTKAQNGKSKPVTFREPLFEFDEESEKQRFTIGIALERGQNTFPKHNFLIDYLIEPFTDHVIISLGDRSYNVALDNPSEVCKAIAADTVELLLGHLKAPFGKQEAKSKFGFIHS